MATNDLGLAVANFLEADEKTARSWECTINGIGERAATARSQELVMALHCAAQAISTFLQRPAQSIRATTRIRTEEILQKPRGWSSNSPG